jgi:hypothetical protein
VNVAERPGTLRNGPARRPGGPRTVIGPRQPAETRARLSGIGRRSASGASQTRREGLGFSGRCERTCGPRGRVGAVPPTTGAEAESIARCHLTVILALGPYGARFGPAGAVPGWNRPGTGLEPHCYCSETALLPHWNRRVCLMESEMTEGRDEQPPSSRKRVMPHDRRGPRKPGNGRGDRL